MLDGTEQELLERIGALDAQIQRLAREEMSVSYALRGKDPAGSRQPSASVLESRLTALNDEREGLATRRKSLIGALETLRRDAPPPK